MKNIRFTSAVAISLFSFLTSAISQDHGHFYVGANGKNQDAPLVIANATAFTTNINYVKTLTYTNAGRYAGYFQGNITFEALPATNALGDAVSGGAALGSWVHAQIASVEGPERGEFAFWESGAIVPTISIPSGTTATNIWHVSNNNGVEGTDPFGHLHGRRFTATKPGLYTVGFKAVDRSTNGSDGGAIHTDSDILHMYFQAGITIVSQTQTNDINTVTFGGLLNRTFHLEANHDLSNTNWTSVGSIAGDDYFLSLTETNASSPRFYRIRGQ